MPVGLILAAGQARRMGQPKQLLPWRDSTLLETVIRRVAGFGFDPVVVTAAFVAERLTVPCPVVINPDPGQGLSGSVVLGIRAVRERWAQAPGDFAGIFLGDQPFLSRDAVARLVQTFSGRSASVHVVRPMLAGVPAHPVLFDGTAAAWLLEHPPEGDRGPRWEEGLDVEHLAVDDGTGWSQWDIDTPEDYRRALAWDRDQDAGR